SAPSAAALPGEPAAAAQRGSAPTPVPATTRASQPVGDAYLDAVRDRMTSRLRYLESLRHDRVTATVDFEVTVLRNGQIVAIVLRRSSGNTEIDLVAEIAIRDSSPLPPLPADLRGERVVMHARFAFDPDQADSDAEGARP